MKELTTVQNQQIVYSGADVSAFILAKAANLNPTDEFGEDITTTYSNTFIPFTNLGAISYSIHRDKMPVRKLGSAVAHSYTTGTRTIAGSIVVINFDRAAFFQLLSDDAYNYSKSIYGFSLEPKEENFTKTADQIPPFDLLLIFSEEVKGGKFPNKGDSSEAFSRAPGSRLMLKNVRLIDEGMVTGTDEAYLESTFQYVAEDIEYLKPIETPPANEPPPMDDTIPAGPAAPYKPPGEAQTNPANGKEMDGRYDIQQNEGIDLYKSSNNYDLEDITIRDDFGNFKSEEIHPPHSVYLLHDGTKDSLDINITAYTPFTKVSDLIVQKALAPSGSLFVQTWSGIDIVDSDGKDIGSINLQEAYTKPFWYSLPSYERFNRKASEAISNIEPPLRGWAASSVSSSISELQPSSFGINKPLYYYRDLVTVDTQETTINLSLTNLDTSAKRITGGIEYNPLEHANSALILEKGAVYSAVGDPSAADVTLSHAQRYFPFGDNATDYIAPNTEYNLSPSPEGLWNTIEFTPAYIPWRKETETKTIKVTLPAKVKEVQSNLIYDIASDTNIFDAFATAHTAWNSSNPTGPFWVTMNTLSNALIPLDDQLISTAIYLTPHGLSAQDIPGSITPTLAEGSPNFNAALGYTITASTPTANDYISLTNYMELDTVKKYINIPIPAIVWDDSPFSKGVVAESLEDVVVAPTTDIEGFAKWWQEEYTGKISAQLAGATGPAENLVDITDKLLDFTVEWNKNNLMKRPSGLEGFVYEYKYTAGASGVTATLTFDLQEIAPDILNFPITQTRARILDVYLLPTTMFENEDYHPTDWDALADSSVSLFYPDGHSAAQYKYKLEESLHYNINSSDKLILTSDVLSGVSLENPKRFNIDVGKNKTVSIPDDLALPSGISMKSINSFWNITDTATTEYAYVLTSDLPTIESKIRHDSTQDTATDAEDWSFYEAELTYSVQDHSTNKLIEKTELKAFAGSINMPNSTNPTTDLVELIIFRGDDPSKTKISRTLQRTTSATIQPYFYKDGPTDLSIRTEGLVPNLDGQGTVTTSPLKVDLSGETTVIINKVDPDDQDGYNDISIEGSVFLRNGEMSVTDTGTGTYNYELTDTDAIVNNDLVLDIPDAGGFARSSKITISAYGSDLFDKTTNTVNPINIYPRDGNGNSFPYYSKTSDCPVKKIMLTYANNSKKEVEHTSININSNLGWSYDPLSSLISIPYADFFSADPILTPIPQNNPSAFHDITTIEGISTSSFGQVTKIILRQAVGNIFLEMGETQRIKSDEIPSNKSPEWFLDSNKEYGYKKHTGTSAFTLAPGGVLASGAPPFPHFSNGEVTSESTGLLSSIAINSLDTADSHFLPYKAGAPNQAFVRLKATVGQSIFDTGIDWSVNGTWGGDIFTLNTSGLLTIGTPAPIAGGGKLEDKIPWYSYLKSVALGTTPLTYLQTPIPDAPVIESTGYAGESPILYGWDPAFPETPAGDISLTVTEPWHSDHPEPILSVSVKKNGEASPKTLDNQVWSITSSGTTRTLNIAASELQEPIYNEAGTGGDGNNKVINLNALPGINAATVEDQVQEIRVNGVNILNNTDWPKISEVDSQAYPIGTTSTGVTCYIEDIIFYGVDVQTFVLPIKTQLMEVHANNTLLDISHWNYHPDGINIDGAVFDNSEHNTTGILIQIRYSAEEQFSIKDGTLTLYNHGNPAQQNLPATFDIEVEYLTSGEISYTWSAAGHYTYDETTSELEVLSLGDPNFPTAGALSSWDTSGSRELSIDYGWTDIKMDLEIWYRATGVWFWDENHTSKPLWIYNAEGDGYEQAVIEYIPIGGEVDVEVDYSARGHFIETDKQLTVLHPNGIMEEWGIPSTATHEISIPFLYGDRDVRVGVFYSSAGYIGEEKVGTQDTLTFYRPSDLAGTTKVAINYTIDMGDKSIIVHYSGKGYYAIDEMDNGIKSLTAYNAGAPGTYGSTLPEQASSLKAHFVLDRDLFKVAVHVTSKPLLRSFPAIQNSPSGYTPSYTFLHAEGGAIATTDYTISHMNTNGVSTDGKTVKEIVDIVDAGTDASTALVKGPGFILVDWAHGEDQFVSTTGESNDQWGINAVAKNADNMLTGFYRHLDTLNLVLNYTTFAEGITKEAISTIANQLPTTPSLLTTHHISTTYDLNTTPWGPTVGLPINDNSMIITTGGLDAKGKTDIPFPDKSIRRDYKTDGDHTYNVNEIAAGTLVPYNPTFENLPAADNVSAQLIRAGEDTNTSNEAVIRFSNLPILTEDVDVIVHQEVWKPVYINYDYYIFEPILYKVDYTLENEWTEYRVNIADPNVSFSITNIYVFVRGGDPGDGDPGNLNTRINNMLELDTNFYTYGTSASGARDGFIKIKINDVTGTCSFASSNDKHHVESSKPIWVDYKIYTSKKDYTRAGYVVWQEDGNKPEANWTVVKNTYNANGLRNITETYAANSITDGISRAKKEIKKLNGTP